MNTNIPRVSGARYPRYAAFIRYSRVWHIDRFEGAIRDEITRCVICRPGGESRQRIAARVSRSGTYSRSIRCICVPRRVCCHPEAGVSVSLMGQGEPITRIIGFLEAVKAPLLLLPPCTRARSLLRSLSFLSVVLPKNSRSAYRRARPREPRGPARMATGRAVIVFR